MHRKTRHILTPLILSLILLQAAGCAGKSADSSSSAADLSTVSSQVESQGNGESNSGDVAQEEVQEVPLAEENFGTDTIKLLNADDLRVEYYYDALYGDSGDFLMNIVLTELVADPEKYNALYRSLFSVYSESEKAKDDTMGYAKELLQGAYDIDSNMTGSYETTYRLVRADQNYVSFNEATYVYLGGAHGGTSNKGYTFETLSGKAVNISDIIADPNRLVEAWENSLTEEYAEDLDLFRQNYSLYEFDTLTDFLAYEVGQLDNTGEMPVTEEGYRIPRASWVMTYDGIQLMFDAEVLGPYAMGEVTANIDAEQYPELFSISFAQKPSGSIEVLNYGVTNLDANGDGKEETLRIDGTYGEYSYDSVQISLGQSSYTIPLSDYYVWNFTPYLLRTNGKTFLYMSIEEYEGYETIRVFDLSDNAVVYKGEMEGEGIAENLFFNPDSFYLTSRYNGLSTMSKLRCYHVGVDGMPVPDSELYKLTIYGDQKLTVKGTVPAQIVSEDGELQEDCVIPVGDVLYFRATNGTDQTDMIDDKGTIYRITIDDYETWPRTIDGKELEDLFDGVMYAG